MTTAKKVAEYFLWKAREHGDWLTNLKLQKLLYYAQGWHLAIFKGPLFPEKIEAWVHGPAIPSVYGRFKRFGWNPITDQVTKPEFEHSNLVDEVFEKYARFSAWELEQMTHEESPWRNARGGLAPEKESKNEIQPEAIQSYFAAKLKAG